MTRDEVITIAKGFSPDDQAVIAGSIWMDLRRAAESSEMDPATWAELERRVAAYEAEPDRLITWDQLKARLASE